MKNSGFTLIEMLVSIAIFMVVAVIAVSALLKIVDASEKSQTLQDAVNNINFAMDSITREVRVGSVYTCSSGSSVSSLGTVSQGTPCQPNSPLTNENSAGASIAFLSSNSIGGCNATYSYFIGPHPDGNLEHFTIYKAQESSCGAGIAQYGTSNSDYAPIIDPSIVIKSYALQVNVPTTGNENIQPSVFLYISGYTGSTANTQTSFDIQTTISERI